MRHIFCDTGWISRNSQSLIFNVNTDSLPGETERLKKCIKAMIKSNTASLHMSKFLYITVFDVASLEYHVIVGKKVMETFLDKSC